MLRKMTVAGALLFSLVLTQAATAQSVPQDKQAEIAMQMRMDKFRNSPLYDSIKDAINSSPAMGDVPEDFDWESVESVFVAVALPENVNGVMALQNVEQTSELPMDMFVKIEFSDSASADAMETEISEKGGTRTINGEEWYTPPADEDGPKNILGRRVDNSFEFATEDYVDLGLGTHLLSSGLAAAWDKMPDDGFRMAVDLQNSSALIEEAVQMGKQNGDPMMGGMLDLILKANDVRLSFDLADGNLLTLAMTGKDEKAAGDLKMGLDGMLAMAKMGGAQGVQQLSQMDQNAGAVLQEILNALNANQDGSDVQIVIPRPEGFEDAVETMMQMAGGAPGGF